MKHSLLTAATSFAALAGTMHLHAEDATTATETTDSKEKQAVTIAESLQGKVQIFKDDKYVPTELAEGLDYYVLYYTASW